MKTNWQIKTIGDVCFGKSSNISQNKLTNNNGIYPIFGASGLIKNVDFFHQDKPYLSIVKDGSGFGRITKMNAFTSVIGTLQYIIPKDEINLNYLNYSLMSVDFKKYVSGAAIPHIYFKDYKNESFVWMPLPNQLRIVKILDDAFEEMEKVKKMAERNLKNSKEIFDNYLNNIFDNKGEGWEEKTLKEVLQKTETIDPTKSPNKEFTYLDVSSVNKETKKIENTTILLGKDAPSRARKLIRISDVIFATVRPTHIRVALITEEYDGQVCSTGYFVLRPKEILSNNFIFYFLLTFAFSEEMEKLQKGASYPAVTDLELKSTFISFPRSLETQKEIVKKLDELSEQTKKLQEIYSTKIKNLEELKKSLLQKAFSGEL